MCDTSAHSSHTSRHPYLRAGRRGSHIFGGFRKRRTSTSQQQSSPRSVTRESIFLDPSAVDDSIGSSRGMSCLWVSRSVESNEFNLDSDVGVRRTQHLRVDNLAARRQAVEHILENISFNPVADTCEGRSLGLKNWVRTLDSLVTHGLSRG